MDRLRLFVYGTLLRGGRYHDQYCRGSASVTEAWVRGRTYAHAGGSPVLVVAREDVLALGTADPIADVATQQKWQQRVAAERSLGKGDAVVGEIFEFEDPAARLPALDDLEGFRPGRRNLYRRVLLPVVRKEDGSRLVAWAYVEGETLGLDA